VPWEFEIRSALPRLYSDAGAGVVGLALARGDVELEMERVSGMEMTLRDGYCGCGLGDGEENTPDGLLAVTGRGSLNLTR